MARYVARRLLATVLVLGLVTLISFSIMSMVPGDPAVVMAGVGASADQVYILKLGDQGIKLGMVQGLSGFKPYQGAHRFWNVWLE